MDSLMASVRTWLFEYDLIIFVTSLLGTGFVNQILSKWQTIREFYPQDATLWHEYTGDSIHTAVVFIILYFILAPLTYISESYRLRLEHPTLSSSQRRRLSLRVMFGLCSCSMVSILIIELGKGYVGALRPSFARACFSPSTPPYAIESTAPILSDSQCTTSDPDALHDARRSFPSGHASLSVSAAAYGQLVFLRLARSNVVNDFIALLLFALGSLWFGFAAWVSASRIYDSAHHVADVATGAIVGLWCAAVHFWFVTGRTEITDGKFPISSSVHTEETRQNGHKND